MQKYYLTKLTRINRKLVLTTEILNPGLHRLRRLCLFDVAKCLIKQNVTTGSRIFTQNFSVEKTATSHTSFLYFYAAL